MIVVQGFFQGTVTFIIVACSDTLGIVLMPDFAALHPC